MLRGTRQQVFFTCLGHSQRARQYGPKWKDKRTQKGGTHKKSMLVTPLPPTAPPADNLAFSPPPQTHFILAVFPTSNFEYTWNKKDFNLCQ